MVLLYPSSLSFLPLVLESRSWSTWWLDWLVVVATEYIRMLYSGQLRPGSGTDKINFIHCQHFM